MKRAIVALIRKNGVVLESWEARGIVSTGRAMTIFGSLPKRIIYKVKYTLAPKTGRYKVFRDVPGVMRISLGPYMFPVCFLPPSWHGKRVNRKVIA